MKRSNKRGFTIAELAIVIAVIAILAAVLIPTFSGVVTKANKSAAQQTAAALYKEAYALDLSDGKLDGMDNGTAITEVEGKTVTYSVGADGVISFEYKYNSYTCTYSSTTNTWSVEDSYE